MLRLLPVLSVLLAGANTLIIPGELPTILSLVYSNIPTIKKGTDSRLGWGFRLGNRADFQVLVELGPQTNTQPLGVQQGNTNSKRNTADSLSNVLYAQRQHEKAQFSNTDGGQWLKDWSQHMRGIPNTQKLIPKTKTKQNMILKGEENENTVLGIGEVDAKLVIPEDTGEDRVIPTQKIKIASTTSRAEALDNVKIDD